jgi:hypothetical protein
MNNAKTAFARKVQETAAQISELDNLMEDMIRIYADRGYAQGAANQYTDEELATMETAGGRLITAADLEMFLILVGQVHGLLNGAPAVQGDYQGILNRARNDI